MASPVRSGPRMPGRMPRRRSPAWREAGFTLVELMVVIVVMGIVAAAAVLAIPDPGGGLRVEAERFAARAKAAQEYAVINGRPTAMRVGIGGYALAERRGGEWRDTNSFTWEAGTQPDLAQGVTVRTVFDSTGLADPLELVLRRREQRFQVVIGSDGEVHVRH